MKKLIPVTALLALLALPAHAIGGFKVPSLGGDKPAEATPAATTGDSAAMQEAVVQKYKAASIKILTAQSLLAKAYGLKEEAAALEAQVTVLGSGATLDKDTMVKTQKLSEDAEKKREELAAKGVVLTEGGNEFYKQSLSPFAQGVLLTALMPPDVTAFGNSAQAQIKNAPLTEKLGVTNKLAAGLYLVKELPGYSARMYQSMKSVLTYAQKSGIEVPADATAALKD